MIYIHALVGYSVRQNAERWQHSAESISRVIHEVGNCFTVVEPMLFIPPARNVAPEHIPSNRKYSNYFQQLPLKRVAHGKSDSTDQRRSF